MPPLIEMDRHMKPLRILFTFTLIIGQPLAISQTLQPWMSPEVSNAWSAGYKGQNTTITFVDDIQSNTKYYGNFNGTRQYQQHGKWTSEESNLIAPSATIQVQDFSNNGSVSLASRGLNVVNLSYAMYARTGYSLNQLSWANREGSVISYANSGAAVISKAAGNDYGTAVGKGNGQGQTDYFNTALINTRTAIFVGALNKNGTTSSKANIANYSNVAGSNATVQQKFLVVGVTGGNDANNKLYGTSFAAPVISGYAAVLGSKFTSANATQITNQLLNTARTDTINNYNANTYGRGEASLTRALAPVSIR